MKCAKFKISRVVSAALTLGFLSCGAGCTGQTTQPYLEFLPHMKDSPALKAQKVGPDGVAGRVPPEGTVPMNFQPYHFTDDPEGAGRSLRNPLPRSKEVLARGQKLYNTYCFVCHGKGGEGDGSVVPKFPRPPSLHSDKVRDWTDGRMYHVLAVGQNLMPSYASQLDASERWAVIHYVRALQRAKAPTPADLQMKKEN